MGLFGNKKPEEKSSQKEEYAYPMDIECENCNDECGHDIPCGTTVRE